MQFKTVVLSCFLVAASLTSALPQSIESQIEAREATTEVFSRGLGGCKRNGDCKPGEFCRFKNYEDKKGKCVKA
ncbi:hypothetical protein B0O99DRAFT_643154 [Bisporella sp. PMI_857]|nr:hypothetical protein B0O99DRAFT_643154 [Bisporella sp. PMI_857]